MQKYRVYYNTHRYEDCSDPARACSRFVRALSADEAREIVRAMRMAGQRYIGMIHDAEPVA